MTNSLQTMSRTDPPSDDSAPALSVVPKAFELLALLALVGVVALVFTATGTVAGSASIAGSSSLFALWRSRSNGRR